MSGESADESVSISGGDRHALEQLFCLTYAELRRLAASVRRRETSPTLNPTALVNEAWLKLAQSPPAGGLSRLHFKRIAARAMRQVLVEAARRRNAAKRGGGVDRVTLDESIVPAVSSPEDLVALDTALQALAHLEPRQAALVELRFFGGLDAQETAQVLGVSEATVLRDWRAARAWLAQQLRREH